jgi:hypothetical protein
MTEQRQHVRYQVEFSATFAGDHTGIGIVYNLGMGGCKVVSDLAVKNGTLLTLHLRFPNRPLPSPFEPPQSSGLWNSSLGWNFLRCRRRNEPVWSSSWQPK